MQAVFGNIATETEALVTNPQALISGGTQFTGKFDLLLTDVVMPGMSGRELAKQLRPSYNMRVLYMSGFADRTLEQGVLDAKEAFLAKPFPLRELATKIRELFREAKSASHTEKKQNRAS